jgi:ankyrin repeat protein
MLTAQQNPNAEVITALVKAGADVNAETANGFTAVILAGNNSNPKIREILIQAGARE